MHKPIVKNGTLNFEDLLSLNPDFAPFPVGKFTIGIMPKVTVIDYEKGNVKLKIGNYCSIGDGVGILLNDSHRPDWITTYPFSNVLGEFREVPGLPVSKGDITIGNDVWIGRNVLILSGVNIGDGAVVGAGSIVTKDVPPYTIVVGNPAHFVKKRFEQETIDELLRIKWWEWDIKRIKENVPLLLSNRVDEFIKRNSINSAQGN